MTAFALISGVIFKRAEQRTSSKTGKLFATCTVKVGADTGGGDFWNVLIFSESAQLELLRLEVGDAVSIRGRLEIKTYVANDGQTKISRSIFADAALGLRPVPRAQKARAKAAPTQDLAKQSVIPPDNDLNDDLTTAHKETNE
jgi:single-stranded DNA-binding protein